MIKVVLFTVVTMLFMVGCSDDASKSANAEVKSKQEVKEDVKVVVAEIKEEAKASASDAKEDTQAVVADIKEETKSVVANVKEEAKAALQESKVVVAEKTAAVQEAIASVQAPVATVDAASLYKVCAGCHGMDGSKPALNKSQVIKGWDAKKISDALHGYKNGTYGGAMKGLMGAQVSKLGDAEIEALAQHISKF